jgi:dihydrodipicolinate synthase/N-acetylneuraminate lyase
MVARSSEEIRARLSGPLASIRTVFHPDGRIDQKGMRRQIDFVIEGGVSAVVLTYGDSLYSLLSDQEIAEVTRFVVEHVAGRCIVVAADRGWPTDKTADFARYAREVGADVLMVLPPDWGGSTTTETLVRHYAAAAQAIPVMVVTNLFIARGVRFGLETIERLRDTVENVVAVKDDWNEEFGRRLCQAVSGQWAVIAGGQKQHHLNAHPYGCGGYLSTFMAFKPQVARDYWAAIRFDNLAEAARIVRDLDMPLFDFLLPLPGGFDAGIHGAMELFGVAPRWRRAPYYNLNEMEMESLAGFFHDRGLL